MTYELREMDEHKVSGYKQWLEEHRTTYNLRKEKNTTASQDASDG